MPLVAFLDSQCNRVPFHQLEETYSPDRWAVPLPLLRALTRQKKNYADITVTELIGPPQIRALKARHDFAVNPLDLVWASFGSGLHQMLELKTQPGGIAEERLIAQFDVPLPDGSTRRVRLGGTPDYFDDRNGTLSNYKVSSVYKCRQLHDQGAASMPEWTAAENVYGYLLRRLGFDVRRLTLCLLLRDWSARERDQSLNRYFCSRCLKGHMRDSKPGREHAAFEDDSQNEWYPPNQVIVFDLPIWSHDEAESYIRQRLELHLAAEREADENLPECTPQETWNGKRCEHWCEVAALCQQRRRSLSNSAA